MTYHFAPMDHATVKLGEDGPYTVVTYSAACTDELGNRWVHCFVFSEPESCERFCEGVLRSVSKDRGWKPGERWTPIQPVYGSSAYECGGGDCEFMADLEPELLFPPGSVEANIAAWTRDYENRDRMKGLGLT
jgi:hypothetical protein